MILRVDIGMLDTMGAETKSSRGTLDGFVVFEGIDGTGTTTQLKLLSQTLAREGLSFHTTAEPTDSAIGRIIRGVLNGEYPATPETLAYLYASDRNEHIYGAGGILEHLRSGELVICDRYIFSSLAYQGNTCGMELPDRLNATFPLPSLLIYFELPPDAALARVSSRGKPDIFERRELQHKVSEAYDKIIDRFASEGLRVLRVDASLPIPAVAGIIRDAVLSLRQ